MKHFLMTMWFDLSLTVESSQPLKNSTDQWTCYLAVRMNMLFLVISF